MKEQIIFSGACAWCMEAIFLRVRGVTEVKSGFYDISDYPYAFSKKDKLEAIQVTYDNLILSYKDLFDVLFLTYNPTINNWNIEECFYPLCRPVIFYFNNEQKIAAESKIKELQSFYTESIHTKLEHIQKDNFTLVDEKYRQYYEKNPKDGFCISIIEPKIYKLKIDFKKIFKEPLISN